MELFEYPQVCWGTFSHLDLLALLSCSTFSFGNQVCTVPNLTIDHDNPLKMPEDMLGTV
jgi:hypothetical protein